jgi:hypothetical protein
MLNLIAIAFLVFAIVVVIINPYRRDKEVDANLKRARQLARFKAKLLGSSAIEHTGVLHSEDRH